MPKENSPTEPLDVNNDLLEVAEKESMKQAKKREKQKKFLEKQDKLQQFKEAQGKKKPKETLEKVSKVILDQFELITMCRI
jgi:hypothetical protein